MPDKFSPQVRSRIMRSIKGKNTSPEILVRSFLHRNGFRFRIHRNDLPGNPDIVLPKWRTIVFVHGCFWHHHRDSNCPYSKKPKSNQDYWLPKLKRTKERDRQHQAELTKEGWKVLVVWECEIDENRLSNLVKEINATDLDKTSRNPEALMKLNESNFPTAD